MLSSHRVAVNAVIQARKGLPFEEVICLKSPVRLACLLDMRDLREDYEQERCDHIRNCCEADFLEERVMDEERRDGEPKSTQDAHPHAEVVQGVLAEDAEKLDTISMDEAIWQILENTCETVQWNSDS